MAKRILIVDDAQDILDIFSMTFEAEGYVIKTALNGIEAVTQAVEFKPDLVVLDLMMPQMDGYEVMKGLKKNSSMNVKILVLSNIDAEGDKAKAKEAGADAYLTKADNDPDAVVAEAKKLLG